MSGHRRISRDLFLELLKGKRKLTRIEAMLFLDEEVFTRESLRSVSKYAQLWGVTRRTVKRTLELFDIHRCDLATEHSEEHRQEHSKPQALSPPYSDPGTGKSTGKSTAWQLPLPSNSPPLQSASDPSEDLGRRTLSKTPRSAPQTPQSAPPATVKQKPRKSPTEAPEALDEKCHARVIDWIETVLGATARNPEAIITTYLRRMAAKGFRYVRWDLAVIDWIERDTNRERLKNGEPELREYKDAKRLHEFAEEGRRLNAEFAAQEAAKRAEPEFDLPTRHVAPGLKVTAWN